MNLAQRLLPLAGPVAFLLVWWGICSLHVVRPVLLPTPLADLRLYVRCVAARLDAGRRVRYHLARA